MVIYSFKINATISISVRSVQYVLFLTFRSFHSEV